MIDDRANWITADPPPATLPIFRRAFTLDKLPAKAEISICGLGHFELRVNGQKVGNNVLDPGWTDYTKTCLYVIHDITALLHPGENVLAILLGNGMYSVIGAPGRYKKFKRSFGPLKLICQLQLDTTLLISDSTWKFAAGPVTFSCIYGGEDYDARLEQPDWDRAGFDDTSWLPASVTTTPGGKLIPQTAPPIHIAATLSPRWKDNVYDLGRNFAGWPQITVTGPPGSTVKLIPGELLDENGRVSQKSSGSPVWFHFTSAGRPQTWHPRFTYTGFRYLQVEGNATITGLSGQVIHSSAKQVGHFSCSNPLLNQIHNLILAAIQSNLQSVLTDCPHREKLGWLEQSHLMGEAIMFNYDVRALYAKICADMRDAQHDDGCMPTIAPEYTTFKGQYADFSNSPEWGSAAILNPRLHYRHYGDKQILRDNFSMMRRYVDYLRSRMQRGIIDFGLGDWYDIGPGDPGYSKLTSRAFTATAFVLEDLRCLAEIAKVLEIPLDEQTYGCLGIRAVLFRQRFFHSDTNQYDRGSQAANGIALAMQLVQIKDRAAVLENLIRDIRAHDNHTTAGDIGFRFVLDALAKADRSDVIFDLLSQENPPSYAAQIAQGATTLTEAWDANPAKSQNHLMLGHAEIWFYKYLAGIRLDPTRPAGAHITITPAILENLQWAQAQYNGILSRWERNGRRIKITVEIPEHSTASVFVPTIDGTRNRHEVGPGSHIFESEVN